MSEILAKISLDFLRNNHSNAIDDELIWYVKDNNKPIAKKEIEKYLMEDDLEEEYYDTDKYRNKYMNTREYHIKRIAYLVKNFSSMPPIDVEILNDWEFSIEDGNHRLAAAIYRDEKHIEANIFGFIDNLNDIFPIDDIVILRNDTNEYEDIKV